MLFSKSTGGFYDPRFIGASIPDDVVKITASEYAALLTAQSQGKRITADASGRPIAIDPPPPSMEQQLAALQQAVQEHLDSTAIAKGYDSILSACSYAGAPNAFQAESVAFITWRGAVWEACYAMLAAFQAGQAAVPTKDELLDALPPFTG